VTAEAARKAGLEITIIAREYTWNGLFTAILEEETRRST
jgi:hypothetical protein